MSDGGANVDRIVEVFPRDARLVRQLLRLDETFCAVCEDYLLASARLAELEISAKLGKHRGELDEYRTLVADLREEMADVLRRSR